MKGYIFYEIIISSSLLILLILVLRKLLRYKTSHKLYVLLWDIVLIRLLVPFKVPSNLAFFNMLPDTQKSTAVIEKIFSSIASMDGTTNISNYSKNKTLIIIWVVVSVILLLRFIIIHLKSTKYFKMSLPIENEYVTDFVDRNNLKNKVKISYSDRFSSPLVYGFFKPKIILTKWLDYKNQDEINNILSHELAHIKNGDILRRYFLVLAVCIYWFNPFVWLMFIFLPRDLEIYCDENIIRNFNRNDKKKYANMLINLSEDKHNILIASFNEYEIEERIVCIMKSKNKIGLVASILIFVAMLGALFIISINAQNKVGLKGNVSDETLHYAYMDYDSADEETKVKIIQARKEYIYGSGIAWSNGNEGESMSLIDTDGSEKELPQLSELFPDWDIDILTTNN